MIEQTSLSDMGPVTTEEILSVLRKRYDGSSLPGPDWIALEEVRAGAGVNNTRRDVERRIDFFVVHQYPSKDHLRIAYEIKVSRGDFLKEISEPRKRRMALMFSNKFYFVTPPDLVDPSEVPPECGLIECDPYAEAGLGFNTMRSPRFREVVPAPYRDSQPPTWGLFVSAIRQLKTQLHETEHNLEYLKGQSERDGEAAAS